MNKDHARAIIDLYDHIYSSGRRGRKALYREKYSCEINTCFRENRVGFNPEQARVWLKGKFPEVVGGTDFWSDKQIKNKYSALK